MALEPELSRYKSEDDYIQRFLVPLMKRLGFGVVVNYHGRREAGMDLIIGEIDQFGHVRYHGLQAKYLASLSKGDSHGLVDDANEAFSIGFAHPHTGISHSISSFFAVNAGSVSDEARDYFFAALRPRHSDNVRLLAGRDLVALDRSAALRSDGVRARLEALLFECRRLLGTLDSVQPALEAICSSDGVQISYPSIRLQLVATTAWLVEPLVLPGVSLQDVAEMYQFGTAFNRSLDDAGASPLHTVKSILVPAKNALNTVAGARQKAYAIEVAIVNVLQNLGPVLPL